MSCFGAASGQSTTRSACQLSVLTISSGDGARPRSFLQHLQIGALSKGNSRNRQPVSRALLRVQARRGTHAVWVPPLGDEENAGQMELLFLPTALVPILDVDRSGEMPMVFVEVSDG